MKIRQLRELSNEDLIQKEKALKKELFDLQYQRKFGRVEKPGRFYVARKDIAKIKTLLNERERDGKQNKQA